MNVKSMIAGYEAWKKTSQGKEFLEKDKTYIPVEIKLLPKGWELMDGGVEDGFFAYSNYDEDMDIIVQEHWGSPCWCGGYPKLHYIEVSRKREWDDRPVPIKSFSIYELGWTEAFRQANEFAKLRMERD